MTTADISNMDNIHYNWEIANALQGGRLLRVTVGGISTWHNAGTFCHMGISITFMDMIIPFVGMIIPATGMTISDMGMIK